MSAETIAALATPVGTAALAVVRASGPDCARLAADIFGYTPPPRIATHADYRDAAKTAVRDNPALADKLTKAIMEKVTVTGGTAVTGAAPAAE